MKKSELRHLIREEIKKAYSVNENVPDDGNVYGWYWPIADQAMEMIKTDSKYSGASLGAVGSGDGVTYITITVDLPSGSEEHFVVNFDENRQATDIESTFISEELEGEGTYRVYMNSDPDEPERINYEIYFGDGTKAEMIKQAKEMAYSNDPTNQYGDPILVKVTHEDYIDDVAWTNIPVNEANSDWPLDNKDWEKLWNDSQTAPNTNTERKHMRWIVTNAKKYGLDPDRVDKLIGDWDGWAWKRHNGGFEDWMDGKLSESVNEGISQKLNNELGSIAGTFAEEDIQADDAEFYDIKPGKYIKFYIEDESNSAVLKVKRIAKANGLKFARDLDDMLLFKESANEGFTKDDWDVKWKLPKDNLFNASKTIDAVNNRSNAIQDLLKLNSKELQSFDNDDEHPATNMSYNELMRWYYQVMKESVNEGLEKNNKVLVKLLKEYSEDYIVVYDKTLKKVIKKFINNKDGYYSGRSKARRFVDDMVKSSDTPFDNLSNYEIGKETEYRSMEESVNEAEFKHINPSENKIKDAIKDVEKKFRLKANRDNPPQYAQLSLNKIMLSKVLGREELGKEHQGAWEKLKKEYNLRDAVNEADQYVDARGNFKLRNGLEVKIKSASEIQKLNMNEDYMKYNLQIAGKTVKIEKAFRGEFGGAPSEFTVKGYKAFETRSTGKPRKGFTQSIIGDVVRESVNEGLPPGYAKFLVSLQTLIGDIAPNAWGNKSQITPSSVKRVHNSLKKRYGDDYAKFNDLLKTQKGQFGNWYLNEPVSEGPGQKHYTKDGKEWTGATHKMPKGPLMTGDPHNDDSEELFHKSDLDEVADPSTVELVGALSIILGGSFGIKFGMDLLTKIVDKALASAKYTATEMLDIVKNNTTALKAAAQEGKRSFAKKLMSLIGR